MKDFIVCCASRCDGMLTAIVFRSRDAKPRPDAAFLMAMMVTPRQPRRPGSREA